MSQKEQFSPDFLERLAASGSRPWNPEPDDSVHRLFGAKAKVADDTAKDADVPANANPAAPKKPTVVKTVSVGGSDKAKDLDDEEETAKSERTAAAIRAWFNKRQGRE